MQNKNTNIDKLDHFSQLTKSKLEGHRLAVDDELWNKIENRMQPKKHKMVWWFASIAASVAIMVMVMLFLPHNKTMEVGETKPALGTKNTTDATVVEDTFVADITNNTTRKKPSIGTPKAKSALAEKADLPDENKLIAVYISNIDTLELATFVNNNADNEQKEQNDSKADSSTIKIENIKQVEHPKLVIENNNNNQKWLLAALVSSSGNVSPKGAYDAQGPLFSSSNDQSTPLPNYAENIMNEEDFTERSHSLPLSFGLMIRKDFNKQFAIETGLMYTYLASTYKLNGIATYDAKQQLHYLGIPLNVVGYIYTAPKWNLYISGGGMVEKGISQKYTQTMKTSVNTVQTNQNKTWIHGAQWSLNASIGVSYTIYNDLNIYFEPRYSYMFDNKQPTSYRTENKNTFGLSGGLRYEF